VYSEGAASADEKLLSSGAFVDEAGNPLMDQNGKPQLKIPNPSYHTHIDGLVCHALSITGDSGASIKRFRALRTEAGGLELDPLLYVFQPKNYFEWIKLSACQCFHKIHYASYGERFLDFADPDGFTTLSFGIFWWLINIRPEYLVF